MPRLGRASATDAAATDAAAEAQCELPPVPLEEVLWFRTLVRAEVEFKAKVGKFEPQALAQTPVSL